MPLVTRQRGNRRFMRVPPNVYYVSERREYDMIAQETLEGICCFRFLPAREDGFRTPVRIVRVSPPWSTTIEVLPTRPRGFGSLAWRRVLTA